MKGLTSLLVLIAFATPAQAHDRPEQRCTAQAFRPFSAAVWDRDLWDRGQPPARTIAAQRNRLGCAPAAHRQAMKRTWRADKRAYFAHRAAMQLRVRVMPFCESGKCYAIPYAIVYCESGADGHNPAKPSGYYGILLNIWLEYGGGRFSTQPWEASDVEQAIIAHKLYVMYGLSPWECAGIVGLL